VAKKFKNEIFRSVSIFDKEFPEFRYSRLIEWCEKSESKGRIVCVMHNPSRGKDYEIGHTVKKLINFFMTFKEGRFGSIEIVNIYPFIGNFRGKEKKEARETAVKEIYENKLIRDRNLEFIKEALKNANLIVGGWGSNVNLKEKIEIVNVLDIFNELKEYPIKCFHKNEKKYGYLPPAHPNSITIKWNELKEHLIEYDEIPRFLDNWCNQR
jgi:hypothetical protein